MDKQAIRRRCAARVRDLTIPTPFDIKTFCAMLGRQRGRPIHVYPMAMRGGSSGKWLMTDTADIILFEQCSTAYHQLHIIFHELGHIVCGHQPGLQALQDLLGLSSTEPNIDLPRVLRLMCRGAYSTEDELEAELFASLLRERISVAPLAELVPPAPELARLLHQLAVSLAVGEVPR